MSEVFVRRWQFGLFVVLLAGLAACSSGSGPELPRQPPPMSVINQSNGVHTEVEADSWCVDGLFKESCAAVDGPLTEVVASCEDQFVVALPDTFNPQPGEPLGQHPAEGGGAWPVAAREGTVLVRAEGSGQWNMASWTFELIRPNSGC